MKNEPVLTILSAFVAATLALLAAFGVDFTPEQVAAITGWMAAALGVALLIRSKVAPVRRRNDTPAVLEGGRRRR